MLKRIAVGALTLMMVAWPAGGVVAQDEDKSIWDGVYNQEQADRGKIINSGVCAKCHGAKGDGANEPDQPGGPSIARFTFLKKWENTSLASLFEYVKTKMPVDNPGSRTDQEYIDAIAYMLVLSGAPVGDTELPADPETLDRIYIEQKPE